MDPPSLTDSNSNLPVLNQLKDIAARSQWTQQWKAWRQTLELLGMPMAWQDNSNLSQVQLNDSAQADLKITENRIPRHLLDTIDRTFLVKEERLLIWLKEAQGKDDTTPSFLTLRERQIFEAQNQGKTIQETASSLGISARTVEKHRENIRNKISHLTFH